MTVQQASRQLLFQLFHIYEEREANNIADLVMENVTEWKRIDCVMNKEVTLSPAKEKLLGFYIDELLTHKPVQYVLKEAWFYGMKLYVDENVLIPRPETEELIDWIYKDIKHRQGNINILDVGTGSGCIALGLKNKLPSASIFACDLSEPALAVAQRNASTLNIQVNFINADFLNRESRGKLPMIDILVSNPPYIPLQDKTGMHPNVLLHEPHLALFVDDHDPLIFYKALADFAETNLNVGGIIYAEIHEQMGIGIQELFINREFKKVELRKDLQERVRMVKACL